MAGIGGQHAGELGCRRDRDRRPGGRAGLAAPPRAGRGDVAGRRRTAAGTAGRWRSSRSPPASGRAPRCGRGGRSRAGRRTTRHRAAGPPAPRSRCSPSRPAATCPRSRRSPPRPPARRRRPRRPAPRRPRRHRAPASGRPGWPAGWRLSPSVAGGSRAARTWATATSGVTRGDSAAGRVPAGSVPRRAAPDPRHLPRAGSGVRRGRPGPRRRGPRRAAAARARPRGRHVPRARLGCAASRRSRTSVLAPIRFSSWSLSNSSRGSAGAATRARSYAVVAAAGSCSTL